MIEDSIKKIFKEKDMESTTTEEIFFYKDGNRGIIDNDLVCAKSRYNPNTKRSSYYIKSHGKDIYNPQQEHMFGYKTNKKWKLRHVSRKIFDIYTTFLKTKRELYIRQIEREI